MLVRLCLLAGLLACPGLAQKSSRTRFLNAVGEPLAGVEVVAEGSAVVLGASGGDGWVEVEAPAGVKVLLARRAGCATIGWRLDRVKRPRDVVLHPPATVTGRVVDAQGRPWQGPWTIELRMRGRDVRGLHRNADVELSEDGAFRLEGVPAGAIQIGGAGWFRKRGLDLEPGTVTDVELIGGGALTVRVSLPPELRKNAKQATVLLFDGNDEVDRETVELGPLPQAYFFQLHQGPYRVVAEVAGLHPMTVVDVHPGRDGEVICRPAGQGRVRLIARGQATELLEGATYIDAVPGNWRRSGTRPLPDDHVLVTLTGQIELTINLRDGSTLSIDLDVREGTPLDLAIDLEQMSPRTIRCVDPEGRPLAGVRASFSAVPVTLGGRLASLRPRAAVTGDDGVATTVLIPDGFALDGEVDWGQGLRTALEGKTELHTEVVKPGTGSVLVRWSASFAGTDVHGTPARRRQLAARLSLRGAVAGESLIRNVDALALPQRVPFPAGRVELIDAWSWQGEGHPRSARRTLATREVLPGEEVTFDVDPERLFAGHCVVEVRVDGENLRGDDLRLTTPDVAWPLSLDFRAGLEHRGIFVPPRPTRVVIVGADGTWVEAIEVDVPLERAVSRRIDVERVERTARFLEEDGAPLAGKRIKLERRLHGVDLRGECHTDQDGQAVLRMGAGEVTFERLGLGAVTAEWAQGMEPLEVRFGEGR
ncbi:MAG: hypothetical protein O2816_14420 [Planctomycetota bacterium]|nr:hypothetical protein [Planctomycetota bacterium]